MSVCAVCGVEQFKYKCSICVTKTCSLACYKAHKQADSCETVKAAAQQKQPQAGQVGAEATSLIQRKSVKRQKKKKKQRNEDAKPPLSQDTLELLLELSHVKALMGEDQPGVGAGETAVIKQALEAVVKQNSNAEEQRRRLDTYLLNCPEFATFCDLMLKKVGARDEEGYFAFPMKGAK